MRRRSETAQRYLEACEAFGRRYHNYVHQGERDGVWAHESRVGLELERAIAGPVHRALHTTGRRAFTAAVW
jgi:hypothetical protein